MMIQCKFGAVRPPQSHYNSLSHLRLPEWRHYSRPLSNRTREITRGKNSPRRKKEEAEDV